MVLSSSADVTRAMHEKQATFSPGVLAISREEMAGNAVKRHSICFQKTYHNADVFYTSIRVFVRLGYRLFVWLYDFAFLSKPQW